MREPEIEIIQKEVDDNEELHEPFFDTDSDISSATVMDNNAMEDDRLLDTSQDLYEPLHNHTSDVSFPPAIEDNMDEGEQYNCPDTNDDLHTRPPGEDGYVIPPLTVDDENTEGDGLLNTNQHLHQLSPASSGDKGLPPPVATGSHGAHGQEEEDGLLQSQQDSEQHDIPPDFSGSVTKENSMPSTADKSALPSSTELPSDAAKSESNGTSTNIEHQDTSPANPVQPLAPIPQTGPALATDTLPENENLDTPALPGPLTTESAVPLPSPEVGPENVEEVSKATGISQVPEKHDTPPTVLESGPDASSLDQTAAPSVSVGQRKPSLIPAGEVAPNLGVTTTPSDFGLPNAEHLDGPTKLLNNVIALPTPQTIPVSLSTSAPDTSNETGETTHPPPHLDTTESPSSATPVGSVPQPLRRLLVPGDPSTCPYDVVKSIILCSVPQPLRRSPVPGDLSTCPQDVIKSIILRSDWTTVPQECVILLGLILNPRRMKSLIICTKFDWLIVIKNE